MNNEIKKAAQLEEEFVVPCELIALKDEYEAV